MDLLSILQDLVTDYTLRTVSLGAAVLGFVSGILGSFAVLRKQSLLGDAISHAALPGIALAFLLTGSKAPLTLILGAAIAGWIGTLFIISIINNTPIKEDTALGLVLSVFFGFGLVLLTFIQKLPNASQAGLDKFLFGQAATLMERDVVTMTVLGSISFFFVLLFWKEFKLLCFNADFGDSQGFRMSLLNILLTSLIVIAIVIGLQTVGVVLMSAMVVAPAAAARQWTDRMGFMVFLAGVFGAIAGVTGAIISSITPRLPTGPTIVIVISGIVLFSLLFAPNRGLIWSWVRKRRNNRRLQVDAVLGDLYILATQHGNIEHGHSITVLRTMSMGHGGTDGSLKELELQQLARRIDSDKWTLTSKGYAKAENMIINDRDDE